MKSCKQTFLKQTLLALSIAAVLAACGGGGGSDPVPPATSAASPLAAPVPAPVASVPIPQPTQPDAQTEPACHAIPQQPHRTDETHIQLLCAPPDNARLCAPVLLTVRLWNFPDAANVFLLPMPDQRGGDGNLGMPAPRFTLTRTPNSPEQIGRLVFDPKTAPPPPSDLSSGYPSDGGIYASFAASNGFEATIYFDGRHWTRC